jgi:hypothetical protein
MLMGSLEIQFFHGNRAQVGLFEMLFVCCVLYLINYKMEPLTKEFYGRSFCRFEPQQSDQTQSGMQSVPVGSARFCQRLTRRGIKFAQMLVPGLLQCIW